MPKVSAEHMAARREQILAAAQICFARKGFHATSMNDVFAEAGLSAGAVYRYFTSKDQIIASMADRAMDLLAPFFAEVLAEDPPPPIEDVLGRFSAKMAELASGPMAVAPQVWAAATYDPEIGPLVAANMRRLRGWWTELARREQAAGRLAPDADVDAVGAVLFGLVPGFMFQHLLLGDVDGEVYRRGLLDLRAAPK
jgi:AcrR family transcriptional regulator